ncbi:MAG: dihydroxyacetone kinase subunit DhaK, partial [Mycoplasma sp.]|nr:dihydroxyacetone kinase subunit DhaK [Mycoplasma sp.]
MKKFINKIENIVPEMLEGMALCYPNKIKKIDNYNVIVTQKISPNKIALISGGGSGHEPSHGGFVGDGMLDAAVAGEIFTSPTPDQIYRAIEEVAAKSKKAFLIVKNYTGDCLNFEMAMEMAKNNGIECDMAIVNDDIALENSLYTVGKRGIAGTIFVHKILGAYTKEENSLVKIKELSEKIIPNIASMGISLDACIVPANGKKGFVLNEDEIELGLGIHGEPGIERTKLKDANYHTKQLMDRLIEHLKLNVNDEVALMINGLGGTPLMELNIIARYAILMLKN